MSGFERGSWAGSREGADERPRLANDGGDDPPPVVTPLPRVNGLATVAVACAILCPIGPGAIVALPLALIALGQIGRSGGGLVGAGRAWAAILLSCVELAIVGHAFHRTGTHARRPAIVEAEARQFLHDFTRYQEDERFGAKARSRMSRGLGLALKPPSDAHLSFEIADALGAFHAFQSCPGFAHKGPRGRTPEIAAIGCLSTFAPDGPPITTEVRLVQEEGRWRVFGFSLKSPLLPRAFSARGRLFSTVQLQDFAPGR